MIAFRSHFVGATVGYAGVERRRAWRWAAKILSRGSTEPAELLGIGHLALAGLAGLAAVSELHPYMAMLAGVELALVVIGLSGLTSRHVTTRARFALGAMVCHLWVAIYAAQHWPHSPEWADRLAWAVVMAWIYTRMVCRRHYERWRAAGCNE